MGCSQSIAVVAPGCPPGLVQELLDSCLLPAETVLLLPQSFFSDNAGADLQETPVGKVRFRQSPSPRFFSARHLGWLRAYLRPADHVMAVIHQSPQKDLFSAVTALLVMLLSGKTITVLRPLLEKPGCQPEPDINLHDPGDQGKWTSSELNSGLLVRDFYNKVYALCPVMLKELINNIEKKLRYYWGIEKNGATPVNLKPLDSSPEAVQRDVTYAIHNAVIWLGLLPNAEEFLKGKRVLEIGPGINFGAMVIFACHGAEVMVADRFLTPWDPRYHPIFYQLLKDNVLNRWPTIDPSPLDRILSQGGYPPEIIRRYSYSLEEISVLPDQSVDLVVSNAVFEHLYDLPAAFHQLFRITKPGGLGIHMVDFRDHRDFSRPLEHLLSGEKEFAQGFEKSLAQYGNRYRPYEMQEFLESAGFEVREFRDSDVFTKEEYLTEFLKRLRKTRKSRYCDCPVEHLRVLTGRFITVRKPRAKD